MPYNEELKFRELKKIIDEKLDIFLKDRKINSTKEERKGWASRIYIEIMNQLDDSDIFYDTMEDN